MFEYTFLCVCVGGGNTYIPNTGRWRSLKWSRRECDNGTSSFPLMIRSQPKHVHTRVCVCVCVCVSARAESRESMFVYAYVFECVYRHMCKDEHAHTHAHTCTRMHAHARAYTYTHARTHARTYTYTQVNGGETLSEASGDTRLAQADCSGTRLQQPAAAVTALPLGERQSQFKISIH